MGSEKGLSKNALFLLSLFASISAGGSKLNTWVAEEDSLGTSFGDSSRFTFSALLLED
jgi:hypothetical protein